MVKDIMAIKEAQFYAGVEYGTVQVKYDRCKKHGKPLVAVSVMKDEQWHPVGTFSGPRPKAELVYTSIRRVLASLNAKSEVIRRPGAQGTETGRMRGGGVKEADPVTTICRAFAQHIMTMRADNEDDTDDPYKNGFHAALGEMDRLVTTLRAVYTNV